MNSGEHQYLKGKVEEDKKDRRTGYKRRERKRKREIEKEEFINTLIYRQEVM